MNTAESVIHHLESEIRWLQAINVLLAQEQELLASREFHALEGIINEKVHLSSMLQASADTRVSLMKTENQDQALALQNFLTTCSPQDAEKIQHYNAKMAEMLILCRDLNMVNGQVIATCMKNSQIIVNTLTGRSTDGAALYTATGNMQSAGSAGPAQQV